MSNYVDQIVDPKTGKIYSIKNNRYVELFIIDDEISDLDESTLLKIYESNASILKYDYSVGYACYYLDYKNDTDMRFIELKGSEYLFYVFHRDDASSQFVLTEHGGIKLERPKLYSHYFYVTINDNNIYLRITSHRKEKYTTVDQLRIDFSHGYITNILRNYTANKMSNALIMLDIQTDPVTITWTIVSFSGTTSSNIDGISGVITSIGDDTVEEL